MSSRVAPTCAATLAAYFVPAESAAAHGLVGRADLPIPAWMFGWGAAIALMLLTVWSSQASR